MWNRLLLVFLLGCSPIVQAERLIIAGTGDSQELLRDLAALFQKLHPADTVEVPESIGSKAGIRAVINGQADLARTARPLGGDERQTLQEFTFALSPIVFAVHAPSVIGITNLTRQQIVDTYAGRIKDWEQLGGPKRRIYAVDREAGDSSRTVLERALPEFGKVASVGKIFFSTPEAITAIGGHEFTLGFLPIAEAKHPSLKIVRIDGIAPDAANVASGRYPFVTELNIVAKQQPTGGQRRFIDFLYSPSARRLIMEKGLIAFEKKGPAW